MVQPATSGRRSSNGPVAKAAPGGLPIWIPIATWSGWVPRRSRSSTGSPAASRPIEQLSPLDFDLDACAAAMAAVRSRLEQDPGFALLDRLPVEGWSEHVGMAVAWLLTALLGPIVEQKHDGTRLYAVRDSGRPLGYGVRRSTTNLEQGFHTDGGWLPLAPEFVGLACLRQAARGGESLLASLARMHDVMRQRHPALLERLYRPFWWDRQAEHEPGAPRCSRQPVFSREDGRLVARYYDDYVRKGHEMMSVPLGVVEQAALDAARAIIETPEHRLAFRLAQGQIEYVNNHLVAHARKAFVDDAADSGRLLLRLWVRRRGGIALEPEAAATT